MSEEDGKKEHLVRVMGRDRRILDCFVGQPSIIVVAKGGSASYYSFKEALTLYTNLGAALKRFKQDFEDDSDPVSDD